MTELYRGMRIDIPGGLLAKLQPATTIAETGQELELGPIVLNMIAGSRGLGTHWSTRAAIAERFALDSSSNGGGTPVMMTVDWDGSGEDLDRTNTGGEWTDEAEVTILPGTNLHVVSLVIGSSFADGIEILVTDKYQRYSGAFAGEGLTVPTGSTQYRTAAEPGGVLPYTRSDRGYLWVDQGYGQYLGVTNDDVNEMHLFVDSLPHVNWQVFDDQGLVEDGNFAGVQSVQDALARADRLLSEFDTNPEIPPKTDGYDHSYTERPNPWG